MASVAWCTSRGRFRLTAKSLVVPAGIYPSIGLPSLCKSPFTASFKVPSPPEHTTMSYAWPFSRIISVTSPEYWVVRTSTFHSFCTNRSITSSRLFRISAFPAFGFTRNSSSFCLFSSFCPSCLCISFCTSFSLKTMQQFHLCAFLPAGIHTHSWLQFYSRLFPYCQ